MTEPQQTWPAGVGRMLAGAAERGLAVEVRPRPAARSLEEAAGLLGITPADIAKTLVLRRSDGSYLFAVLPGDTQLAWPKFRALVGVNKLTLPDAAEALAATGYARGTITPVGSTTAWPLWVDTRLAGRRVAMGAGDHGFSAFLDADALVTAYAGTVADLAG
ncbi:Cys-tRNA(Pro) deacylase [Friedmanniella luteola]|uniref:Cys-tRNA(Pro) deacylase n=1 Tax=Friedmanniella luteola TaxID=546871 RepID=A0A1H1ML96_9ACTN|nr:YbaK/EbsC family protein [Friedmanniella luteola]SDR87457.1 Cys-tRNA(Pro) deacylase [Friedmanniella luteola]